MAIRPNLELISSRTLKEDSSNYFLRVLLLGDPKVGKTYTTLKTCVKPVFHINCDQRNSAKKPAKHDIDFDTSPVTHSVADMYAAIKMAKFLALDEGYKTVVWDTVSGYFKHLVKECKKKHGRDSRAAWGEIGDQILEFRDLLLELPVHVIVLSHYENEFEDLVDEKGKDDVAAQRKARHGRVPLLQGRARRAFAMEFDDVLFMEKRFGQGRIFVAEEAGVFGPGSRSQDETEMKANWRTFMRHAGMLPSAEKT